MTQQTDGGVSCKSLRQLPHLRGGRTCPVRLTGAGPVGGARTTWHLHRMGGNKLCSTRPAGLDRAADGAGENRTVGARPSTGRSPTRDLASNNFSRQTSSTVSLESELPRIKRHRERVWTGRSIPWPHAPAIHRASQRRGRALPNRQEDALLDAGNVWAN